MLKLGGLSVDKLYAGNSEVNKMYLGEELVFDNSSIIPDYYVALSGDNSNGLTESTAWNNLSTLQSNIPSMPATSVIGFKGGDEFFGQLAVNGNQGLKLASYGTGKAVIKGSKDITGFTPGGGGVENPDLITNGDFASATGWTTAAGVVIQNHQCEITFTGNYGYPVRQNGLGMVEGQSYDIQFTIRDHDTGDIRVSIGGTSHDVSGFYNLDGTYNVTLQRNVGASDDIIFANGGAPLTCNIDNVSLKLTGGGVGDPNIWTASTVADNAYQVFKGGVPLPQVKLPWNTNILDPDSNVYVADSASSTTITSSSLQGLGYSLVGCYAVVYYYEWRANDFQITAHNDSTGQITWSSENTNVNAGDHFFIANGEVLLQNQDGWWYDSGSNELKIYSVDEPTEITINTIDGDGIDVNVDNAEVDNIIVRDYYKQGIDFGNQDNYKVTNSDFIATYEGGTYSTNQEVSLIDNNTFRYTGTACVTINRDITWSHNSAATVTNNDIKDHNIPFYMTNKTNNDTAMCFRLHGANNTAQYNDFDRVGYVAIRGYGRNNNVQFNYVKNYGLNAKDGSGLYTTGGGAYADRAEQRVLGSVYDWNILENDYVAVGRTLFSVYLDDNTLGVTANNNTVIGTPNAVYLHNTEECEAKDNECYNMDDRAILAIESSQGSHGTMVNNIITGNNILFWGDRPALWWGNYTGAQTHVDFGTVDNNRYWQPNFADVVNIKVTGIMPEQHLNMTEWRAVNGTWIHDVNSEDDTEAGVTITDSQCVYNKSKVSTDIALVGTWTDMDGNVYNETINLLPYQGIILYQ